MWASVESNHAPLSYQESVLADELDAHTLAGGSGTRSTAEPTTQKPNKRNYTTIYPEARIGFEPTNTYFADRRVRPLHHRAKAKQSYHRHPYLASKTRSIRRK
jgi:hypothetical protein